MSAEPGAGGRVLLLDLGGGSCEITLSEHKRIKETISLPLGAVRLTEQFLHADPPPRDGLARMRQLDRARTAARASQNSAGQSAAGDCHFRHGGCAVRGVCGSRQRRKTAAKSARKSATGGNSARARSGDGGIVPARAVRKLAGKLAKMSLPEREAVPGIGPRRAEIIVAGAQVYAELLESFGLAGFRYSPLGLRDGILAQMLAEQDARAKAHREFEHERWESVLATARRYGVDPRQAEPVRGHAVQLFAS